MANIKKNTITVFVAVDHYTNVNHYLEQLHQIVNQLNDGKWRVEIITISTPQVPEEVRKIYENLDEIKSRFSGWPEWIDLIYYYSDDHSYNKILNYIENKANGSIGELVTMKSIAPIVWLPNHLMSHVEEYNQNKKNCGWMISRLEIKDLSQRENEKGNTVNFRIEDFPDHIDKIIPDEIFMTAQVASMIDYNKAAIVTNDNNVQSAMFHAGRLLVDEIKPKADKLGLSGFNPKELTIVQWIDMQAILKDLEARKQKSASINREDGSVEYVEADNEDGSIIFTEE